MGRTRFGGSALAVLFLKSAGMGALFLARYIDAFSCKDESGDFVDFFAALKVRQSLRRVCLHFIRLGGDSYPSPPPAFNASSTGQQ